MKLRALLLATILAAAAAPVEAQVSCGATVTTNSVMTADLQCPSHSPAFTVKGPATVDMAGHRVLACARGGVAAVLDGSGATLKNGAVTGCDTAVRLAGKGKHTVENVIAREIENGFVFESPGNTVIRTAVYKVGYGYLISSKAGSADDNTLKYNIASDCFKSFSLEASGGDYYGNIADLGGASGFIVVGNSNTLRRNKSTNNEEYGYFIDGSFNRLDGNLASANYDSGFYLENQHPQQGNRFLNNIAMGHEEVGFVLGAEVLASENLSVNNWAGGFKVLAPNVTLLKNTSAANGDVGMYIESGPGLVKKNRVLQSAQGIEVGASGVTITGNTALSNFPDLMDDSPTCAGNTWTGNIFATHDHVCAH
jgi:hypothetical protein